MLRLLALVALVALGSADQLSATPDPYAIFEGAEAFWYAQPYPLYLNYDVAVSVTQDGQQRVERYKSAYDATNGRISVDAVSDYEREHPVKPTGMNVCIIVYCVTKPLPPIDFIGVPILAPTYTFGMAPFIPAEPPSSAEQARRLVEEIRREFHDPYPAGRKPLQARGGSTLPTIAHEVAAGNVYTITLEGIESIDGHDCYHLVLRPRENPGKYRLRDLWIDTKTSATWRLNLALNFVDGPGTTVPWTVDFDDIAGVQYILDERATGTVRNLGQSYSQVTVSFENVQSGSIPAARYWSAAAPQTLREPL
jgi:hypothetical protein